MRVHLIFVSFTLLCLLTVSSLFGQKKGCTDVLAINFDPDAQVNDGSCIYKDTSIVPTMSYPLPDRLEETSGLIWWQDLLWTHNDDTDTQIYGMDIEGIVLDSLLLKYPGNRDWEEIGQDDNYIYVADVGNNATGRRADLHILRFPKTSNSGDTIIPDTIWFQYADQDTLGPAGSNDTDFDCEAFVLMGDSIVLFTKQWISMNMTCYLLPKSPGEYIARPFDTIETKGLITGASYLEDKRIIILTGYTRTGQPFLYLIYDFSGKDLSGGNKRKLNIDKTFFQIEAITHVNKLNYYVTNERFVRSPLIDNPQGLHLFDLSDFLGLYVKGVQHLPVLEQGIRYRAYPNPFDTGLTIQVPSNYLGEMSFICDLTGKVVWQGFLSSDKIHIDTSLWPPGQYYFISRKQRIPVVKAGQ